MTLFQSIILGIVEGVTEFLPVSSTGHLILASRILNIAQTDFLKSFEIAIQLGAILAVVFLYFKTLLIDAEVLKRVIVAFIPTGIIGLAFYRVVKTYLLGNASVVLWALFLGGAALIIFELFYKESFDSAQDKNENGEEKISGVSYKKSLAIGLFQSVAVIPGVSRAAATIIGGLALGLKRKTIVEFSFLLAVPTMATAAGWDLFNSASIFSSGQFGVLLAGFVSSFVVAILAVKFLLNYIGRRSFVIFGVYRLVLAALFWLIAF